MQADIEREQRRRRRRILGWIPYGIMAALIITAVVLVVGFNQSWWVQKHPVASASQQYHGQSTFTQAGIDYSGRVGRVVVSLAPDRPAAKKLGLKQSATARFSYIVPVTMDFFAGNDTVSQTLQDTIELRTQHGRIAAVRFVDERAYSVIHARALQLLTSTGDEAAVAGFDGQLASSRAASGDTSYDAVATESHVGMNARVELAGTPGTAKLTIELTPAQG